MGEFLTVCPKSQCISTVGTRTDLFLRDPYNVPITDFFGSVRDIERPLSEESLILQPPSGVPLKEPSKISSEGTNFEYLRPLPI
ncbi:GPI-anchor transamidase [Caligus rogercresseyi]|uniref:GPI-anchor transamidase n=1 Tax=Caligus rogercresseyi TaxID=217165 RepID=A0A7T8GSC2_CALRO|nr:GPI-anchor transamidase [Caligus rogercresseyi]